MNQFEEIIQQPKPVLIDFYADWCAPCQWLNPILDELEKRVAGQANILKINSEEHEALSKLFDIRSVPTLIIFKNGQEQWRMQGFKLVDELEAELRKYY